MITPAQREQDVLFPVDGLRQDEAGAEATQTPATRFPQTSYQYHRQAAQGRSDRLRTIEALRRPRK